MAKVIDLHPVAVLLGKEYIKPIKTARTLKDGSKIEPAPEKFIIHLVIGIEGRNGLFSSSPIQLRFETVKENYLMVEFGQRVPMHVMQKGDYCTVIAAEGFEVIPSSYNNDDDEDEFDEDAELAKLLKKTEKAEKTKQA